MGSGSYIKSSGHRDFMLTNAGTLDTPTNAVSLYKLNTPTLELF